MPDAAPFDCLRFAVSKPGWGTSSLVLALVSPITYELRVKRIEQGISVADGVRDYSLVDAVSLYRWIHMLGFHDKAASSPRIPGAGSWSLDTSFNNADDVTLGGTAYPESFPDLLSTMRGLGLPGFENMSEATFLSDFCSARPSAQGTSGATFPADLGIGGLEQVFEELMKDPHGAEDALREQFRQVPDTTKHELLAYVRQADPEHYEWWKRILLG